MKRFVRDLNHLYLETPALWEVDDNWDGFSWIYADSPDWNMVAYKRRDTSGNEIIAVINYSPVKRDGFIIEVDSPGEYEVLINSDLHEYGGKEDFAAKIIRSDIRPEDGHEVITMTLPPLAGIILRKKRAIRRRSTAKKTAAEKKPAANKAPAKKRTTAAKNGEKAPAKKRNTNKKQ